MANSLFIYGATGYTGRLITESCLRRGLRPVLCARDEVRLKALADSLGGLEARALAIDRPGPLAAILAEGDVLLNAAGPFSRSARCVVDACLAARAHYLDITGEVDVFEALAERDHEARARGVMLLPGAGFDIVASDCLARHVKDRAPHARWLAVGVSGLGAISRGSYRTLVTQAGQPVRVRRQGRLVDTAFGSLWRSFDFGNGPVASVAVSWGDVVTAWHSTRIPDIDVYFEATPMVLGTLAADRMFGRLLRSGPVQKVLEDQAGWMSTGPGEAYRRSHRCVVVAEVGDERGLLARARLVTPEAYAFTAEVASEVAVRVVGGSWSSGFWTPSSLLGAGLPFGVAGVRLEELPVT